MALKNNTWKLNQWYDQSVAGNVSYTGAVGALWGWGQNENGGLGLNSRTDYSSPIQVSSNTTWNFPPSGGGFTAETSVFTKTDGTLWSWGYNYRGMLGQNSPGNTHLSSPTQIPGTTWSTAAMSRTSIMAVKTDGTLWVWGNNTAGALGLNQATSVNYSSPVQVPGTTWDRVTNNNTTSYAFKTDGTLWGWGAGNYGNFGINSRTSYSSPVQIPGNWAHLAGGSSESKMLATKTDGTLWAWGNGYYGGLGNNTSYPSGFTFSSPVQVGTSTDWDISSDYKISNSDSSSAAIKTDGTLWSWGYNNHGILGQNNQTSYSSPVQVPGTNWNTVSACYSRYFMATKTDGTLWNWGVDGPWMGGAYYGNADTGPGNIRRSSPVQVPGAWGNVLATRRNVFAQTLL